jgi:hypothetical protein
MKAITAEKQNDARARSKHRGPPIHGVPSPAPGAFDGNLAAAV